MPRGVRKELDSEAQALAEEYNRKIADLQKRKAEALKKYSEKTEKKRIKAMQRFVSDIMQLIDDNSEEGLNYVLNFLKDNADNLNEYIMARNINVPEDIMIDNTINEVGTEE